jgi:ATP-dependent helicase HrpB
MSNGRGACFDAPEPLSVHEWLVIAELDGDRRDARIFLAAAYDSATLSEQFASQLHWRAQVVWDDARQAVTAERRLWLGALIVRCEPLTNAETGSLIAAMCAGIRAMGIAALPWTRSLRALQARVETLRRLQAGAEQWPDFSDAALMAELEQWLTPFLEGVTSLKALARLDLGGALHSRLTWRQRQLLDALAPTHMAVPSGRRLAIDYSSDPPVLAVRVQEMFGVVETPAIAEGRLPLTLHLLSPAGRPVQITSDLAGFWRNSYPAVKKELKGRYPKHPWPDDPLNAAPTARAKPKKRAL